MSQGISLTPEQREAAHLLDADCIVSAGAGSGKTRVLVERFLHILSLYGDDPAILDSIVAITFTEKAATEMKGRIRRQLAERMEEAERSGRREEADRWYRLMVESERAAIMTIHAFCARLLRDFPVEAGVDPQFAVLDEAEARLLLRDAVREELLSGAGTSGDSPLLDWLAGIGISRGIETLSGAMRKMAGYGWTAEELGEITRRDLRRSAIRLKQVREETLIQFLEAGDALLEMRGGKRLKAFQAEWPRLREHFLREKGPEILLPAVERALELLKGHWGKDEDLRLLRDRMKEAGGNLAEALRGQLLLPAERETLDALLPLLARIEERYAAAKRERKALDFEDLQLLACRLLEEREDVRRRLRGRIRFLMVDEYQDTNGLQKRLIDTLRRRPDGSPAPGKLFVVGDPKQSIYRFRGADVSVFGKTRKELLAEGGREVTLKANFRSDPRLVRFANGLFSRLMPSGPGEPDGYREAEARGRAGGEGPCVEYLAVPGKEERAGRSVREAEARLIARRIADLIAEGWRPGDIAVLFRAMTEVKRYEEELIRRGIPFYVVKGRGFYDRQEIADVLNLLRWLTDPEDTLALAGVLRSPFCAASDETLWWLKEAGALGRPESWAEVEEIPAAEREKLEGFRRLAERAGRLMGRVPVADLIEEVLEESGYHLALWATPQGEQARANLEKLVRLARSRKGDSAYSPDLFLEEMELLIDQQTPETEAAVQSEGADSVKLMTIHQSKGLEFPVVIIPDLARRLPGGPDGMVVDEESGLAVRLYGPSGEALETARWLMAKEKERRLEREESVRLFYVAVTRAEKRLILSGVPEEHKEAKDGGEILSSGSWSKWLDAVLDYGRIDWEAGRWALSDGEGDLPIAVWGGEGEAPEENATRSALDRFLEEMENGQTEVPDDEDWKGMRPRGLTERDRVRVSVTRLMVLINCPRKYFYQYVIGMPSPEEEDRSAGTEEVEEDGAAGMLTPILKGNLVHRMLELLPDGPLPEEELSRLLRQAAAEMKLSPALLHRARKETEPLIRRFLSGRIHREARHCRKVMKEVPFFVRIAGLEMEGIIDRLQWNRRGEWELIDYKTNDVAPQEAEEAAEEYLPQLRLYALAARREWGIIPARATLFFLRPGVEVSFEVDGAWLDEADRMLESAAGTLKRGGTAADFAPRPGKRCAHCAYRWICEAAQGSARAGAHSGGA